MNPPTYAPERRPLRSRDRELSHCAAHWLAQRAVSANAISCTALGFGVLAGVALALTALPRWDRWAFIVAAVFVQLRLLGNMLDGMVALETKTASPVGELYNEVPDRLADAAILFGGGYAAGGWPMLGALAACVAIFVAYVRAEGKVAGAPQDFCGPMAKPHRMFTVTVFALLCGALPQAWQPHWDWAGRRLGLMTVGLGLIVVGGIWTAVRRLCRSARALRNKAL